MPTANLKRNGVTVKDGLDSIVIVKDLGDIPGGRTLDVTGFESEEFIKAGHIIIYDIATSSYKPCPVSNEGVFEVPEGKLVAGVLKATITVRDPRAAILTLGQVNAAALPHSLPAYADAPEFYASNPICQIQYLNIPDTLLEPAANDGLNDNQ